MEKTTISPESNIEVKIAVMEKSLDEVKEEVSKLADSTSKGLAKIEAKLDTYVTKTTYQADKEDMNKRIEKNSQVWEKIAWTVVLAVIGALLTLVLKNN